MADSPGRHRNAVPARSGAPERAVPRAPSRFKRTAGTDQDGSPEEVLAECLARGMQVVGSRVVYVGKDEKDGKVGKLGRIS